MRRKIRRFIQRRLVKATLAFTAAASAIVISIPAASAEEGNVKVQLLGINDLHGKIDVTGTLANDPKKYGQADYLAAYLRQREAANPNTITMHSGDMVGGSSPVSALLQDEPTVEIMESIGLDIGTVGNHEFDEGVPEMNRLIKGGDHANGTKGYDGMNFPLVAANVNYKDTGKLLLEPYKIIERGGEKIAFIGVATTATPANVVASAVENIEFTDEAEAINKYVPEVKNQGVKAIVVLAHVPVEGVVTPTGELADLANKVDDEVDVIYGAHNHKKANGLVDNKLLVQAWEYGKAFVDVDLEIDRNTHDIVKKQAEIVDVVQENITPDPAVREILKKYADQTGPKLNEVVGKTDEAIEGGYGKKGAIGDNALGNLIADGMNASMKSDFALMNGGGIRDVINAGDITWGELFNVQPFGNYLVKTSVTGEGLRDIVNAQISSQYGPDCSIGGFTYKWDGKTNKVTELKMADGSPVQDKKVYTLTVNNYMYDHTDDKYRIRANGTGRTDGAVDLDATVNFVKSFKEPIAYKASGRISEGPAAETPSEWEMEKEKSPVGRLILKKPVKLMKHEQDGSLSEVRTLNAKENLRVYGSNSKWHNVGGDYFVAADSNTVLYTGRVLIKEDMKLYSSNGLVYRTLKKGEAVKVYSLEEDRYKVGNGYYVKKDHSAVYFEGMVSILGDVSLWKEGQSVKTLKRGSLYRVYGVEDDLLYVGGGYSIKLEAGKVSYSKN
ncbi:5'-nucleotidase C-terminal domain-containing protein [Metabacillus sp. KIGAM252]|uniref:5'-nucleotidase C-terminal domain-containing protein n=1 Tax=Metabacillus flavus TaxID=2823519 RepID=A0ABS5LFP0_9BACI|nr:5'-nucleotidase C-terminal domain-containing protein [Metabacillus flavus]MBS2969571.1 5'-nucleotidase C-terminal domain-containing protein [Metabacillus flavus]